jgi:hypothetical protein
LRNSFIKPRRDRYLSLPRAMNKADRLDRQGAPELSRRQHRFTDEQILLS